MSLSIRPLRYAHSEGHTDVCFTENGKHIITCGRDGDIRVWAGLEDDEPESFCVGEAALSVVQKNDSIYVCTDDSKVLILKYPSCERDGLLTRFTAPSTHITVAKNKPILACVSEDFSVKVFNLPQDVNEMTFTELQGPALSVALSPNGKHLAVSSGDGKLYIWNLETKCLVKTIDCVPYSNNFTSTNLLCRISFDDKSKFLTYPHHKEVIVVSTDHFQKVCTLSSGEIKGSFSIAQFSPCGKIIVASTQDGEVCAWHFQSKSVIGTTIHPDKYNICTMAWNPQGNGEIVFCDVNGQLGNFHVSMWDDGEVDKESVSMGVDVDDDEMNDLDFIHDKGDDDDAVSLNKLKDETLRPSSAASVSLSTGDASRALSPEPERPRTPPNTLQPPFQPSSTPIHLEHRFMVYNETGIIQAFNDGEPSIDIQFHDVTISRNLYLKNVLGHTMGSMSNKVVALACETPSKLVCIPTETNNKQWTVEMTELEEILCVTASANLVAVATDTRFLRVFSIYGTQRAVLSIPGPVVALASYKHSVLAIYHSTTSYSKDQNLNSMFVTFEGLSIQNKNIPIPLTPTSSLIWVGFTDKGSVATYDSSGILRQYNNDSNIWIPTFDANVHAKGASDSYFITHVNESLQILGAIHCKGTMYPATTPRPILMELPLQTLLCELSTDKAQLEEKLFRWSQSDMDDPDKTLKETALKLFALACRNELDDRALELLKIVGSPQLINLALKYANRLNRSRLIEKLTTLLNTIEGKSHVNQEENVERSDASNNDSETKENDYHSQDIFSPRPTISSPQINTRDMFPKSQTGNPFLRKNMDENVRRNPLGLTDVTSDLNLPSTSGIQKIKETKVTNEPVPSTSNTNQTETFVSWFTKEKNSLEEKHPDLSPSELTQLGLKLYKKQSEKRKAMDEAENGKVKQQKLSAFSFSKR